MTSKIVHIKWELFQENNVKEINLILMVELMGEV